LYHPCFICRICGKRNIIEVDATEGFPQTFTWDCERCCHAHEITAQRRGGGGLDVTADAI